MSMHIQKRLFLKPGIAETQNNSPKRESPPRTYRGCNRVSLLLGPRLQTKGTPQGCLAALCAQFRLNSRVVPPESLADRWGTPADQDPQCSGFGRHLKANRKDRASKLSEEKTRAPQASGEKKRNFWVPPPSANNDCSHSYTMCMPKGRNIAQP